MAGGGGETALILPYVRGRDKQNPRCFEGHEDYRLVIRHLFTQPACLVSGICFHELYVSQIRKKVAPCSLVLMSHVSGPISPIRTTHYNQPFRKTAEPEPGTSYSCMIDCSLTKLYSENRTTIPVWSELTTNDVLLTTPDLKSSRGEK